jgi:hypothetical protein
MIPHEEEYPRRPEHEDAGWRIAPVLLGVAAIALVGVMVLTGNG